MAERIGLARDVDKAYVTEVDGTNYPSKFDPLSTRPNPKQ